MIEITYVSMPPLEKIPTWIGSCECPGREWIMAVGRGGRCPHCGTRIEFVRVDEMRMVT
jgi:hypothetical protein